MTHPGNADVSVFVVDDEGEADQTVFAVNGVLDLAPSEGDTIVFTGGKWVAQAGGGGGGAPSGPAGGDLAGTYPDPTIAPGAIASTPPGQAAHYIGTWAIGTAYAAGECVRQWDGAEFKLYQAKKATTGDDPTSVAASWAEVTTPIVMWGGEHPITTDSANIHGPGITAPLGAVYLYEGAPGTTGTVFQSAGSGWTAGTQVSATSGAGQTVTLVASLASDLDGDGDGNLDASIRPDNNITGTGDTVAGIAAGRRGDGDGSVYNSVGAIRDGTGAGNAIAQISANINDDAVGIAISGTGVNHHAGGQAHVYPTATATEAFNDVKAPLDLLETGAEPANPAVNIGRLFAIDDGAGHTQLVVKFNDGGRVVLATDGGTLGPVAQGAQKTFDQTANAVTATAVPAALGAFSGTLLSDVLTAIPTLIDGVNTNRKLINSLIDVLQEIKAAQ